MRLRRTAAASAPLALSLSTAVLFGAAVLFWAACDEESTAPVAPGQTTSTGGGGDGGSTSSVSTGGAGGGITASTGGAGGVAPSCLGVLQGDCGTCLELMCCPELAACNAHPGCVACLTSDNCGDPAAEALASVVMTCANQLCVDACF